MAYQDIINWLLEPENPSVRFRTQTELLDLDIALPEVKAARAQIDDSKTVQNILKKMHPDGYWLQKNPRTKESVGDGAVYGSFATTHFCLAYLSELALTRSHPAVEKAASRYLDLLNDDGDWWNHMSCLYGYNIRTFIRLGYREDQRLQKVIRQMLETDREDGGYLCDMHEGKYKTKEVKSCIRGSVKTLMAFAELPERQNHPRCLKLVNYFLNRRGVFNSAKTDLVNRDMKIFSFPITWGANSWEILLALSKMGYGKDTRLHDAWKFLNKRKTEDNKYPLHSTPSQSPFNVGKKNEPNKWITFYILLAEKYRDNVHPAKQATNTISR